MRKNVDHTEKRWRDYVNKPTLDELMKNVDIKDKDVYVIPYGGSVMPQLKEVYERNIAELK